MGSIRLRHDVSHRRRLSNRGSARCPWQYVGRSDWQPGCNVPALRRGPHTGAANFGSAAGLQLLGNLLTNAEKLPEVLRASVSKHLGSSTSYHTTDVASFVARLGGKLQSNYLKELLYRALRRRTATVPRSTLAQCPLFLWRAGAVLGPSFCLHGPALKHASHFERAQAGTLPETC